MKSGEDRICPVCGKQYYRYQSQVDRGVLLTCSRTCAARHFRDKPSRNISCQNCGTMFRGRKVATEHGFSKYCSRACEVAQRPNPPVERTCIQCGKTFMKAHGSVLKSGGKFCSRICIDAFKRKLRKRGEKEMFTNWQKREWKDDHCAKCGVTTNLELDHRVPRFAGGKATQENAQTLCGTCNRKKFWTDDYPLYLSLLKQRALVR